jgi:hypothetical protein
MSALTARACLDEARRLGGDYQLAINAFADDFRRASPGSRQELIAEAPSAGDGPLEALVAATVSFLCHEQRMATPAWTSGIRSAEPFFVLPARSFEMRVRLMLESPPPFRNRRVYVPESYLDRA